MIKSNISFKGFDFLHICRKLKDEQKQASWYVSSKLYKHFTYMCLTAI